MAQILKWYGVFLLEAVVLFGVVHLCVQQKYFEKIGEFMPLDSYLYETYDDFREVYYEESKKKVPEITYIKGSICTGKYRLTDLIEAYDYENRRLEIRIHSVLSPENTEKIVDSNKEIKEIMFDIAGIYTITASAVDDGNRKSVCTIRIPVNSRKGTE